VRSNRILLVEDDPEDIELLKMHLRHAGLVHQLIVRRNGAEAMEFLEDTLSAQAAPLPDLIISDIKMPRMTGLELARGLHEDARFNRIPLVFLTSSMDKKDEEQAMHWGARLFMQKPYEYEQFAEVIRELRAQLDSIEA
jgi:two-component system, response regulator